MRALTLAVIALLHLMLALAVWRAKPNTRINRLFTVQTLTFVGWTLGNAAVQTGVWIDAGTRLAFASASLIPAALLMFTVHYPDPKRTSLPSVWERVVLCAGGLFAFASLTTNWLAYDVRIDEAGLSRRPGLLYPLFTSYFLVVTGAGLTVFAKKWRSARERQRTQLNYYGVGLIIAAVGGMTTNLIIPAVTGTSSFSHLGPHFGLALIALTAHAIIRHRFMDLRVVVHRGLTFTVAGLLSLVPAGAFLLLVPRPMLAHLTLAETLMAGASFLGVALLIPLTRDLAGRLLDRYVYRARTNPQRLLRQASTELTRALDLSRLLEVITNTIHTAVEPEGIATYLEREGSLRLSTLHILDMAGSFSAPLEPAPPILNQAIARAKPLLRDELDATDDVAVREALEATSWALALPLMADQRLVGLIAVGPKRSGDPFFSEDVDALTTLANHAGSAVKNASLHAEVVLANEYVNNIVAAMQNGVVAVDASGVVTRVNPAAVELLGLASETLLKADDLPGPLRTILQQVLEDGHRQTAQEMTVSGASPPQPVHLLCTASPMRDQADHRVGAVAVFSDLTPLKELDQQRARAESLANLQRMTQAVAHEIGNPLVPIKTLTKLLPQRVGDRSFAQDLSRIVSREIERIERLVARLRRVAPQGVPSYSDVDLRIPMRHALEVLQAEAARQETRLESALYSSAVPIVGDSAELEELFLNLLTNALEAVADQPPESRLVQVSVATDRNHAVAQIRDSGPGIAADVAEHIFDPFVTTKLRGSGLGLAICGRIAERHRGYLTGANAQDGGAIFTVTLPLVEERRA